MAVSGLDIHKEMKGDVKLKAALDIELMSITGMLVTPRIAINMNE